MRNVYWRDDAEFGGNEGHSENDEERHVGNAPSC